MKIRQIETATYSLCLLVGNVADVINDLLGCVFHVAIVQFTIVFDLF